MAFCGICGAENSDSVKYCSQCGRSLDLEPKPGMCVECGSLNVIGLAECGNCGAKIRVRVPEERPPTPMASQRPPAKKCQWCGNEVVGGGEICAECESRRRDTKTRKFRDPGKMKRKASRRLALGGYLLMMTGFLMVGLGLLYLLVEWIAGEVLGDVYHGSPLGSVGVGNLVVGAMAIIGGVFSFDRRHGLFVMLSSVLALLVLVGSAFILPVSWHILLLLLGVGTLWMIASCMDEFD